MNKSCARCEKTVYPIEELKCLDKVWHKGCFKCQECGMTLSMKTYKGFNKLPYCEAHIPRAKATTVAETPEMKRLAENTKNQSNAHYHAEFEKNKAKFTQVADDPETRRFKQNSKIISNASYHGDLERKAWMESKRTDRDSQENISAPISGQEEYHQPDQSVHQVPPPQQMHSTQYNQPAANQTYNSHTTNAQSNYRSNNSTMNQAYTNPNHSTTTTQPYHQHSTSINHMHNQPHSQNYYHKAQGASHPASHSASHPQQNYHPQHQNVYQDNNHNSPYSARGNSQTLIYSSQTGPVHQAPTSRVGSIADYDPVNDQYGSITQTKKSKQHQHLPSAGHHHQVQRSPMYPEGNQSHAHSGQMNSSGGQMMGRQNHGMMQSHQQQHKVTAPPTQLGRCFRAIYDYEAADTDEVSFRDGDLLVNCTSIDEGWMMGTVQRTGKMGMLPANYVERAS